jgi:hypothetical protein
MRAREVRKHQPLRMGRKPKLPNLWNALREMLFLLLGGKPPASNNRSKARKRLHQILYFVNWRELMKP